MIIGLGTVWILDGLEVTIIGSIGDRLTEPGSGIALDASQIGSAAAFYATVATGFFFTAAYFFACRFLTGIGISGEYAAIDAAIDELIPARVRGRVDLIIQAFLYNAVTFHLGTILGEFFNVGSGQVPLYIAVFGISNFLGPLTLGRLFDTVGRKTMISLCYLTSAALTAMLGVVLPSTTPTT